MRLVLCDPPVMDRGQLHDLGYSTQESAVVEQIFHGLSGPRIARNLGITERGFERSVMSVCTKMRIKPRERLWRSAERICGRRDARRFEADPRFRWANWPSLQRRPPDLYDSRFATLLQPFLRRLPAGLGHDEAAFYAGVFHLLRDRMQVHTMLVELEDSECRGPDARQRLLASFEALERRHGIEVADVDAYLGKPQMHDLLRDGKSFNDLAGHSLRAQISSELKVLEGHWCHGSYSHRLQLHLVLRAFERAPARFGSPAAVLPYYKKLGERRFVDQLDWRRSGILPQHNRDLFFQLFDTTENNPSSPGFFFEYRQYWPDLAAALY